MSDTPLSDAQRLCDDLMLVPVDFARKLERRVADLEAERDEQSLEVDERGRVIVRYQQRLAALEAERDRLREEIPNYRETIVWPEHERPGKPRRELPVDPAPEERIAALEAERDDAEKRRKGWMEVAGKVGDDLAASRVRVAELEAERERLLSDARQWESAALVVWAVDRWQQEVSGRPLQNIHRRTLDDTWRQVIRHGGGDPVELVGPAHDDLLAGEEKP